MKSFQKTIIDELAKSTQKERFAKIVRRRIKEKRKIRKRHRRNIKKCRDFKKQINKRTRRKIRKRRELKKSIKRNHDFKKIRSPRLDLNTTNRTHRSRSENFLFIKSLDERTRKFFSKSSKNLENRQSRNIETINNNRHRFNKSIFRSFKNHRIFNLQNKKRIKQNNEITNSITSQ